MHVRAGGRRGGLGAERGERALLDARVHVRLVVVADVEHVVVAVDGARQRLDADVGRAAVAREAHHRAVVGLLALRAQAGLDAGEHAGRGGKRRDHRVVGEAELREVEPDGAHAARGQRATAFGPSTLSAARTASEPPQPAHALCPKNNSSSAMVLGVDGHDQRPPSAPRARRRRASRSPRTTRGACRAPLPTLRPPAPSVANMPSTCVSRCRHRPGRR